MQTIFRATALKKDTASVFEKLVKNYQATRCHILEDGKLQRRGFANLITHKHDFVFKMLSLPLRVINQQYFGP
jgi:hypothetical protein